MKANLERGGARRARVAAAVLVTVGACTNANSGSSSTDGGGGGSSSGSASGASSSGTPGTDSGGSASSSGSAGTDSGGSNPAVVAQFVGRWKGVGTSCSGGDSVVQGPPILYVCPDQILLTGSNTSGGISTSYTFCGPFTAQGPVYAATSSECTSSPVAGCYPILSACTWDVWDQTDATLSFALESSQELLWLGAACVGGGSAITSFAPDPVSGGVTDAMCSSTACTPPASTATCSAKSGSSGGSSGGSSSSSQCGTDCDCPGTCGVCTSGQCSNAVMGPYGCTGGCS